MRNKGWILLPALVISPPGQESLDEYQALAKIMKPFIALVSWPGAPEAPLRFGIIGGIGFGTELDLVMNKATVGGRKVHIRYLTSSAFLSEPLDYDVVFIDQGQEARLPAILAKTHGKPILTLGYAEGLARKGVMVNFYLEGGRVRFEVNALRIKEAGLSVSSHLLKIAQIVEG